MITDSLLTCLTGSMRRSHEKYIEQKMSNLYKIILYDDGESLKIAKLIEKATAEAHSAIDREEREKREQATMLIASQSLDSTDLKMIQAQEEEAYRKLGKKKSKATPGKQQSQNYKTALTTALLAGTANVEVAREGLKEFASVDENDGLPSASDGFVTVQSATPAKERKEKKEEPKKSPGDLLKANAEKGKADAGKGKDAEEDVDMSKFTVTKVAKDSTNK